MAESVSKGQSLIVDEGLDKGLARLTPDKIEKTINTILTNETGARLKTYVSTCVHCGLCSEACHVYLSTQDPACSPVGKVKNTIWEILKKKGESRRAFYPSGC